MRPLAGLILCALLAICVPGTAGLVSGEPEAGPSRYVVSAGQLYAWDGASPRLTPPVSPGDLAGAADVLALRPYDGGRRLLLLEKVQTPAGKEKSRREGLAVTFDTEGGSPRRLRSIPFEGQPYADAITPDGQRAYVLARRAAPGGPPGAERHWLHEIDLPEGRLLGSVHLATAPAGVAVQPDGRRAFVALADRIQTYTTGPLVGSWHYRSPGPNGDLVIRSGDGTVCVSRGGEVALFDPAAIAARASADRRVRSDDASAVVPLPFEARRLDLSEDGRLAAVWGRDRMAFLDCATQSLVWPVGPTISLAGAQEVRTLSFPAAGQDLVLALFPTGDVVGFRTPSPPPASPMAPATISTALTSGSPQVSPSGSPAAPRPVPGPALDVAPDPALPHAGDAAAMTPPPIAPAPPEPAARPASDPALPTQAAPQASETSPPAKPEPPPPAKPGPTSPAPAGPAADEKPETPATATPSGQGAIPPDAPPQQTPVLSGRITGDLAEVGSVVLYGPNSIVKECGRVVPGADGTWSAPLPPPGTYRVVPLGKESGLLPAVPPFLTVRVNAGEPRSGLDFEIRTKP